MEYRDELEIAQKAEQMLTGAIRNKTNSFADHYNGKKEDEPSLKEASAKSYVKKYGRKKDGNQQIFLRRTSRFSYAGWLFVWLGMDLSSITESIVCVLVGLGNPNWGIHITMMPTIWR